MIDPEDFQPEPVSEPDGFGARMSGAGRWVPLDIDVGIGLARVGVLWTDDGDNLGLYATPTTDPRRNARWVRGIRKLYAQGVSARDAFDLLADAADAETSQGNLGDIPALYGTGRANRDGR